MKNKAILTFDFEFWYNRKFLRKYLSGKENELNDHIEKSTMLLLNILKRYNQRATFFVLGQLAEKYPEIIKKISQSDHEVGSHGYSHQTLRELGPKKFEEEIKLSKKIIKKIIKKNPKGFRAPNFSLNKKTKWALKILKKNNFQYDSSLHPLKNFKFSSSITEIPPSLGGFYFRLLPLKLYLILLKSTSKTKIPVVYLHLHDLFDFLPKINSAPLFRKKIAYYGTKYALKKFEKLLKKFNFISIEQYLHENSSN